MCSSDLVDSGRARFAQSWDQVLHLEFADPAGTEASVGSALDALVAAPPDTAPCRALVRS